MEFNDKKLKVAIIHDHLLQFSEKENVLIALHNIFPKAPIYTLLYREDIKNRYFKDAELKTSFFQRLPGFMQKYLVYMYPISMAVFEKFNLRKYDLVISSSSLFAKAVITNPEAVHISYFHSYLGQSNKHKTSIEKRFIKKAKNHIYKIWDTSALGRVDYFVSNSKDAKKRISKLYQKDAFVVYPPAGLRGDNISETNKNKLPINFFLVVADLNESGIVEPIIQAFNILNLPLVIIGEGVQKKRMQKISGENIIFLGDQPNDVINSCYRDCLAYMSANKTGFDVFAIEAMLFGKPVLAKSGGWASEIMVQGVTGEFFESETPELIADSVKRLENNHEKYNDSMIKSTGNRFTAERFYQEFSRVLKRILTHEFNVSYADRQR